MTRLVKTEFRLNGRPEMEEIAVSMSTPLQEAQQDKEKAEKAWEDAKQALKQVEDEMLEYAGGEMRTYRQHMLSCKKKGSSGNEAFDGAYIDFEKRESEVGRAEARFDAATARCADLAATASKAPLPDAEEPPSKKPRLNFDFPRSDWEKLLLNLSKQTLEAAVWKFRFPGYAGKFFPSPFIVRDCYREAASLVLSEGAPSSTVITGTPGIGKTCFRVFLLALLLPKLGTDLACIYFQSGNGPEDCVAIRKDGDGHLTVAPAEDLGRGEKAFYLFDLGSQEDVEKLHSNCVPNIITTSPKAKITCRWNELYEGRMFYLPSWTKQELLGAEANGLPIRFSDERYAVFGSVLRFYLKEDSVALTALTEQFKRRGPDVRQQARRTTTYDFVRTNPSVERSVSEPKSKFEEAVAALNLVFRYQNKTILPISHVIDLVFQQTAATKEFEEFLDVATTRLQSTLAFERYVHRCLATGVVDWKVRCLGSPKEKKLMKKTAAVLTTALAGCGFASIPCTSTIEYLKTSGGVTKLNETPKLILPTDTTNAVDDGLLGHPAFGNNLFAAQVTIGKDHPISHAIADLIESLPFGGHVFLVFFVPHKSKFAEKNFVQKLKPAKKARVSREEFAANVWQFIVQLPPLEGYDDIAAFLESFLTP